MSKSEFSMAIINFKKRIISQYKEELKKAFKNEFGDDCEEAIKVIDKT